MVCFFSVWARVCYRIFATCYFWENFQLLIFKSSSYKIPKEIVLFYYINMTFIFAIFSTSQGSFVSWQLSFWTTWRFIQICNYIYECGNLSRFQHHVLREECSKPYPQQQLQIESVSFCAHPVHSQAVLRHVFHVLHQKSCKTLVLSAPSENICTTAPVSPTVHPHFIRMTLCVHAFCATKELIRPTFQINSLEIKTKPLITFIAIVFRVQSLPVMFVIVIANVYVILVQLLLTASANGSQQQLHFIYIQSQQHLILSKLWMLLLKIPFRPCLNQQNHF